jgi:hypothetical protein
LNNNTAGVREREETNRTRAAGHLDEIQGVVTNTLNSFRQGAVGFIDWLDVGRATFKDYSAIFPIENAASALSLVQCGNVN